MNKPLADIPCFSGICIDQCKGKCCDPWWGIIAYTVRKEGGLSRLRNFEEEIVTGISNRARRIMDRYVTNEPGPRPLFTSPEKYNVTVENIKITDNVLLINIRAMFAFKCLFLSEDNKCTIHPSVLGGDDIRPPHCGYLGSPEAIPGGKGYCRIIHAAASSTNDASSIKAALKMESEVSDKHYREGCPSPEMAAGAVIEQIREYCSNHAPSLLSAEKSVRPGRNEPCHCGSGKKYKRCHGM